MDGTDAACKHLSAELGLGGWVVLAERSRFRRLGHEQADEDRRVVTATVSGPHSSADAVFDLPFVRGCPLSAYPVVDRGAASGPLVLENREGNFYDTPAPGWLGLRPSVAQAMGWIADPGGLCRWIDADGRTMAESVWWTDGCLEARWPTASGSHVGEGWLVLASAEALNVLRGHFDGLQRWRRVTRQAGDGDERGRPRRTCTIPVVWS